MPYEAQSVAPERPMWPAVWLRWLVWLAFVAVWTYSLERPYPQIVEEHKEFEWLFYSFGKALHVTAYACFAILSGWLHVPRPYRWGLFLVMSAHAVGTEYFQQYTPTRYPSVMDVGLDHVGIALGTVFRWKWWRFST